MTKLEPIVLSGRAQLASYLSVLPVTMYLTGPVPVGCLGARSSDALMGAMVARAFRGRVVGLS